MEAQGEEKSEGKDQEGEGKEADEELVEIEDPVTGLKILKSRSRNSSDLTKVNSKMESEAKAAGKDGDEAVKTGADIATLFVTAEHGIQLQGTFPLEV